MPTRDYFPFTLSVIGTLSMRLRDFTMSFVVSARFPFNPSQPRRTHEAAGLCLRFGGLANWPVEALAKTGDMRGRAR